MTYYDFITENKNNRAEEYFQKSGLMSLTDGKAAAGDLSS
jgi:hypothetical protein